MDLWHIIFRRYFMRQARDSIVIIHTSELLYKWSTKVGTVDVWPLYMQSLGSANEITQIPVGSRSHEKTQEMTVTHSAILNDACIQTIYFLGMFMEFSQFGMITGWMTSLPYPVRLKKIVPQRTRKGSSHLESSHEFKAV